MAARQSHQMRSGWLTSKRPPQIRKDRDLQALPSFESRDLARRLWRLTRGIRGREGYG